MKKYYFSFLVYIIYIPFIHAQLSDLHYLPPLKQEGGIDKAIAQQQLYFSTPETAAFNISIYRGTSTTPLTIITGLSATNSQSYTLPDNTNDITLVSEANAGQVLNNAGLRIVSEGGEEFYVNYRGRSNSQATSLTSKGRKALGTIFKWGGRPNYGNGHFTLNAVLGVMATQDGTTVTIFDYGANCTFRNGTDADGLPVAGANSISITLQAGESYVLEAPRNNGSANIDCWLGATIQSNKPIAIANGNLNGAPLLTSNGRDAGIDQPVPENVLGKEYVFVRAQGSNINETPIIIATQEQTEIFINGAASPIATIDTGEYFVIPGTYYSSASVGGNMYVTSSKKVYAYQNIAGSSEIRTAGLNFIAPVNCLLPNFVNNIHNIRDVAGANFSGGITITTAIDTPDSAITVEDANGAVIVPPSTPVINASGTPAWKTITVSNLRGDVAVNATGSIAVGFFGVSGNAGVAGYFSGFDSVPVVSLDTSNDGCLPADLSEISGTFDTYQWYKDGTLIPNATSATYTPDGAGDFSVQVSKNLCTYDSASLSVYNCDPEIIITKTADTNTVIEGDTLTFTITVTSGSATPVTNLVITDVIPTEFTLQNATTTYGSWTDPEWHIDSLFPGEMHTLTLEVTVNETPTATTVTNTITNTQDQTDANTLPDDPEETITIINNELAITKTDRPASDGSYDTVGEVITYDFIVTNTGTQLLPTVTISDPLIDTGSLTPATATNLAVGASANFTATHTITQEDLDTDQVSNTATAKALLTNGFEISDLSDDPDDPTTNSDDPTITPLDQKGALTLQKIAQPSPDGLYNTLNEVITYEFTVTNTGNVTLTDITITDSNIDTGSLSPASIGSLAPNTSATFTATHTITQTDFDNGSITNQATASGTEIVEGTIVSALSDNPTTMAPNDPTIVSMPQNGQLSVTKVDDAPTNGPYGNIGETITYTITVTNIGNVSLTDVNVLDPNATTIALISTTGTDTGTDAIVDTMQPLDTAVFQATHIITQEDLDSGQVINTATVGGLDPSLGSITDLSDDPDDPTTDTQDPTIVPLLVTPSLNITKLADDDSHRVANETIIYTYTLINDGTVTFDQISLSDIHTGTGSLSPLVLQNNGDGEIPTNHTLATLPPGQSATWTASYTVTEQDIINQTTINNTVTVSATPRTGNMPDPVSLTTTEEVSVHPIVSICGGETLAHDLMAEAAPNVVSVNWAATDHPLITGETTANSADTIITDTLINNLTSEQTVTYNITGYDASNTVIDQYPLIVTIQPLPTPTTSVITIDSCTSDTLNESLITHIGNFNEGVSFSWNATDNPNVSGETTTTSTDPTIADTLVNTSSSPQQVVYTITPTAIDSNCVGDTYTMTVTITPELILPANDSEIINCIDDAIQPPAPIVTDSNGTTIVPVITENEDPLCEGDKTYTFTYSNCPGSESIYTYTYTIDKSATLIVPPDESLTVACLEDIIEPTAPEVIDACGNVVSPILAQSIDPICEGKKVFVFVYTDCTGNDEAYVVAYNIEITTPPVVPSDQNTTIQCIGDAVVPTAPTVTDACGNDIIPVLSESTAPACLGEKIYTFTYTDCAGNESDYTYTYTIENTTLPSVPEDQTEIVECIDDAIQPVPAIVSDACGNEITPSITENTAPSCQGDKTYTFTYTDCAGNTDSYTYTYTLAITTLPVVPTNETNSISCLADAIPPTPATVTDVCGNIIAPVISENTNPTCNGEKIYTITYTDCAGNQSNYTYTYTINNDTPPVVPLDQSSTISCIDDAIPPTPAIVTDTCGNDITPIITENTDPSCQGQKIYTITYTDCAGNQSEYTYTYDIINTIPPAVPADQTATVSCIDDAITPTPEIVTDTCGNNITPTITATADPECQGQKTYTLTYTDCAGNSDNYTYTYDITNTTPPVVPADQTQTVSCIDDAITPTPELVTDTCGNNITPTITANTDPTCQGQKTYTLTYTDCAGNTSSYTYTYDIINTTPPAVPADQTQTIECLIDAVQPTAPVVTDSCGNDITPSITTSNDPTCQGQKIYTFTYTDCAGNQSEYTYTYEISVTTLPSTPVNQSETIECIDQAIMPIAPTVTDVCGNNIIPTITENTDPTCQGDKIYTFTYTDCAGNTSSYTYTYTIDTTIAPTVPADQTQTVSCIDDVITPTPTIVTDTCGNNITPVITENTDPACQGDKIYTITYTDCAGNTSSYTYTYTIQNTTAPLVPADQTQTVSCIDDAIQPTPQTVTDACGNNITPVITENTDPACQGDKIYTITYTDCAGNTSSYTYTYTIQNTTVPIVPTDQTQTISCIDDAIQPTPQTVTDACGNNITPVITENTDPACQGDKIYTITYTDCAGNTNNYTYTYTIQNTTAPLVPADQTQTIVCNNDVVAPTPAIVTDACGNNIIPTITETTAPSCQGQKTYTIAYTDCAGNTSSYTYTYNITTTTAPIVPADQTQTVACSSDAVQPAPAIVTDACGNTITPTITETSSPACLGDKIYTITYTDCAGNTSSYTYTYTIDNTTAPIVPADQMNTVQCITDISTPTPAAVTDACGNTIIPTMTENANPICEGIKTYTFTYTDCAGNTNSYTIGYTIDIVFMPTLPQNQTQTIQCIDQAVPPIPAPVTDSCGNNISPTIIASVDPSCQGEKTYTFLYSDCAENTFSYTHTYIIDNDTSPIVPADQTQTVACSSDAIQPTPATVTDACGNNITPSISATADTACLGQKIYTITYTDCAGNTNSYTHSYTITNSTPPVAPADQTQTVSCNSDAVPPTPAIVTDACGNNITPSITETIASACQGEKRYTITYTDCTGNSDSYTYTYTIINTTPPTVPTNQTQSVACSSDAIQPTPATVTDACRNNITPVIVETTAPSCQGQKVYTITYTDCAGNASSYDYTYTIDNTTAPIVPTDQTQTIACSNDATQPIPPAVVDTCGNTLTPTITTTIAPTCQGQKTYTIAYTDCAGNTSSYTYTYTIDNTTAPIVPTNQTQTVTCSSDAIQPIPATVTDTCGNTLTPTIAASSSPACQGEKIYTITYTDCAGNTNSYTYTYTIDNTTAPIVPADQTTSVSTLADAVQPPTPTVTDYCGNTLLPTITENNDPVCDGEKKYFFAYTDCAGNTSLYTYTYIINLGTSITIPDQVATSCSSQLFSYDIATLTNIPNTTFQWSVTQSGNTTGASSSNGTLIEDRIQNLSGIDQNVHYSITPINAQGCTLSPFTLIVTVLPEPIITSPPGDRTCSIEPLNHILSDDVQDPQTTFSWYATSHPDITGATTTVSTDPVITDVLINNATVARDITYTITPTSAKGCIGSTYTYTVTIYPAATMAITKVALPPKDGSYDTVGEKIHYQITLTNPTNQDLQNITLQDPNADSGSLIPATLSILAANSTATAVVTHTITQNDIDNGLVINQMIGTAIDPCGTTHTFLSDDPDTTPVNDATVVTIHQNAAMSLTKIANPAPDGLWDTAGEIITYTLHLTNTGNTNLQNIVITDTNADSGSVTPPTISSLAPQETRTITASHTITTQDLETGFVVNSASVTATDPNGITISDQSDDPNNPTNIDINNDSDPDDPTVTMTPQTATMRVEKTVDRDTYTHIGDTLNYTITITNTSNTSLEQIQVRDPYATFTSVTTIAQLAPQETFVVTAQNNILPEDLTREFVSNTAYVTAIISNTAITIIEDSDDPNDRTNIDTDLDGDPEDPTLSHWDTDGDDIPNYLDQDDDNDGIIDTVEQNGNPLVDTDGDTIPDHLDIDADGDGVYDYIEAGHSGSDSDGDGMLDGPYGFDGISDILQDNPDSGVTNYTLQDTDADAIPDYQDNNDDNDALLTIDENPDPNGDGVPDDAFDSDGNGIPDYLDPNNGDNTVEDGLQVFNAVTPNGDGNNDVFIIRNIEQYPDNTLKIYNRWGVVVYQVVGYGQRQQYFSGMSNARATVNEDRRLPVGTYFYILEYKNKQQKTKNRTGYLYLNR